MFDDLKTAFAKLWEEIEKAAKVWRDFISRMHTRDTEIWNNDISRKKKLVFKDSRYILRVQNAPRIRIRRVQRRG